MNSLLEHNRASFDGGAICTRENAQVTATGTVFRSNEAKTGGAVFVDTQGDFTSQAKVIQRYMYRR
jgi:predicted outer membrane repeat protein